MAEELKKARKALRELEKSLRNWPDAPAPNDVHNLRTASRRLQSITVALESPDRKKSSRFAKSQRLVKSIEPLRKAAGSVRDMDVLTSDVRRLARFGAHESLTPLLTHLEAARQQYAAELQHALHHKRKAALENLKEYSGLVKAALKREKQQQANSALNSSADANEIQERIHAAAMNVARELGDWAPLDAGNLHEFRLKVKQLRYTLQLGTHPDPGLLEELGQVQRSIGVWHDWQQLNEIAREVLALQKDPVLLDRIDTTAKKKLTRALAAANALRGKYLSTPVPMGI